MSRIENYQALRVRHITGDGELAHRKPHLGTHVVEGCLKKALGHVKWVEINAHHDHNEATAELRRLERKRAAKAEAISLREREKLHKEIAKVSLNADA